MEGKQAGKSMKLKTLALIGVAALGLATVNMHAQENTTNFLQTAEEYLTSNNTNFTFVGTKLELETGLNYQNGLQWANDIKAGYNVNDSLQLSAKVENAGVAGVVTAYEAGISYAVINSYAIKCEAGLEAGYNHQWGSPVIEPGVTFKKKLTDNTYSFIGLSEPVYLFHRAVVPNPWVPNIRAGVGVTF